MEMGAMPTTGASREVKMGTGRETAAENAAGVGSRAAVTRAGAETRASHDGGRMRRGPRRGRGSGAAAGSPRGEVRSQPPGGPGRTSQRGPRSGGGNEAGVGSRAVMKMCHGQTAISAARSHRSHRGGRGGNATTAPLVAATQGRRRPCRRHPRRLQFPISCLWRGVAVEVAVVQHPHRGKIRRTRERRSRS